MRRYFCPDFYVETYRDVTLEMLESAGIRYLLLDIDNTFAPYEQPEPDEEILAWFDTMKNAGIRMAFVSNNGKERVELFNQKIGIPVFPKGKKPLRTYTRRAMLEIGAHIAHTAVMGDQIFTDVWAGKRLGVRTILLPPINDKRDVFTRFKRLLEKPIMRYYRKRKEKGK